MVGDTTDKIEGIKGFGPSAWAQVDARFGDAGLTLLDNMCREHRLIELEADSMKDKLVKRIFDNRASMQESYKLASLHPSWVNTLVNPLQWEPGFAHGRPTDMRLAQWAATKTLVTTKNWAQFTAKALSQINNSEYVALDIETSTPAESDDWLQRMENPDGVDVMGSELSGMSLTFGKNNQHTVYISVDHVQTDNVKSEDLRDFVAQITVPLVIHNTMFEGPVLFNAWGEAWKDNGYRGMLKNWYDTKFEMSYVDENNSLGLKALSKRWFDYDQVDYKTVTTVTVAEGGECAGRLIKTVDGIDYYSLKMNELTARHVFDYACDDTMTTAGLHNFAHLFMNLEGTWDVYRQVELEASYQHAMSFVNGFKLDLRKLRELKESDTAEMVECEKTLNEFLISKGWSGTVCPVYSIMDAPAIKEAYEIIVGEKLDTMVRTPSKLIDMIAARNAMLGEVFKDVDEVNKLVASRFDNSPDFNAGSPKQMQELFYSVMGLPVRVFNKPTEKMRAEGKREGTPKTDNLAIMYALREDDLDPMISSVLEALRVIKMVKTRIGLFYDPYPDFVHWKTGRVHSSHQQCATNTRRASSAKPNMQQMSKNQKIEGFSPRVREIMVPHHSNAVIVSFDFKSQEIVLMAAWSGDPGLVELFASDNPKDMHCITGVGIYNAMYGQQMTYDEFNAIKDDKAHPEYGHVKACRALGKAVNFGSQYRIAAKKLSSMLFVTETEAQLMLDAKADAFPIAERWSLDEMAAAKETGIVKTMLGAVRHLGPALMSDDFAVSGKAERQAISYRIQGSAAEQTKLAEGRMWAAGLEMRFDAQIIGPIHDEVVVSVAIADLPKFLPQMHECMVAPYGSIPWKIGSSISIGANFGEQYEVGEEPAGPGLCKNFLKFMESLKENNPRFFSLNEATLKTVAEKLAA